MYYALRVIAKNGAMLMRKMSEALLVTPANVTGIVDRLEQKGLIRRTASQGDRRVTIVECHSKGESVAGEGGQEAGRIGSKVPQGFHSRRKKDSLLPSGEAQREMSRSASEE